MNIGTSEIWIDVSGLEKNGGNNGLKSLGIEHTSDKILSPCFQNTGNSTKQD